MRRFLTVGGLACLLVGVAPATTFAPATTKDLIERAERVCCVACERVEARKDPRTGLVFTHIQLRLLEDLKGRSAASTVQLRIVGGTDGGVTTVVPGMPSFKTGRESVLLLGTPNRSGFPVVVDGERGVLKLERDKRGRRYLGTRVSGLKELKGKRRVRLDAFRGAVRRVVREQEERARLEKERKEKEKQRASQEGRR